MNRVNDDAGRLSLATLALRAAVLGLIATLVSAQAGTVLSEQKIGPSAGNFTGPLTANDGFGSSITALGDVDGDGIGDVAVGTPMSFGTPGPGEVWILFLNADRTVKAEKRIDDAELGFVLGANEQLGSGVTAIGDFDSDGITEIAVGAAGNTDVNPGGGAVWILFLDSGGNVKSQSKYSPAGLAIGDSFGSSVATVGDLDGDGNTELAVGARGDNAGGVDAGAVWILFLDGSASVVSDTKISSVAGSLGAGTLSAFDSFGSGVTGLGDLDGDLIEDIAVGAPGDDDGAMDTGAIWVLFLDAAGGVLGMQKVSESTGSGLSGRIFAGDAFGDEVSNLGDLDGDGIIDLGVGASRTDDGTTDAGAVWILSLSALGTSTNEEKISATSGGFGGLINGGLFGAGIAPLGDLDGDGRAEVFVGEAAAFGGGGLVASGAVWALSLVSPSDVVWIGSVDDDWFNGANWSGGVVPDLTKGAIIRQGTFSPSVGANAADAEVLDLFVNSLASVSLPTAAENLRVDRNAFLAGPVSGSGELRMTGTGYLFASATIIAPVAVASTGTVTFTGANVTIVGELRHSLGTLAIADVNRTTVVFLATFSGGTLLGSTGVLNLDGPADFTGTSVVTPPTIEAAGNLTFDASFVPSQGQVLINGGPTQTVTSAVTINMFDLEVNSISSTNITATLLFVARNLRVDGAMEVNGNVRIGGVFSGGSDASFRVIGDVNHEDSILYFGDYCVQNDTIISNASPRNLVIDLPDGVPAGLEMNLPGGSLTLLSSLEVLGGVTVTDGDLLVEGEQLLMPDGGLLDVLGGLSVGAGGSVELANNVVRIQAGATLSLVGTPVERASFIAAAATAGGYALTCEAGSTVEAMNFRFEEMGPAGVVIDPGAILTPAPRDFRNGLFDRVAANGVMLDIERTAPTEFRYLQFEDSLGTGAANLGTTFNIRTRIASQTILLTNWSGAFSGPTLMGFPIEDDPLGDPGGLLIWGVDQASSLGNFGARQQGDDVSLRWASVLEVDVADFVLERAGDPAGPYTELVAVTATGPGNYSFLDTDVMPGTAYWWRLSERLTHGQLNELGMATLKIREAPAGGPADPGPFSFLTVGGGPGAIAQALGSPAARAARNLSLLVEPGVYDAFEIRSGAWRALRIRARVPGTVVVDVANGPVSIRSIGLGKAVELAGLVLDGHATAGPALVIEDTQATVLLDHLLLEAGWHEPAVRLVGADRVVLQHAAVAGPHGLDLTGTSNARDQLGRLGLVAVDGTSVFRGHGTEASPALEPGAAFEVQAGRPPLLEATWNDEDGLDLVVRSDVSGPWWLLGSPELELREARQVTGTGWFLRGPSVAGTLAQRVVDSALSQDLLPSEATGTYYLQVLVYDLRHRWFVPSPIVVLDPMRR